MSRVRGRREIHGDGQSEGEQESSAGTFVPINVNP